MRKAAYTLAMPLERSGKKRKGTLLLGRGGRPFATSLRGLRTKSRIVVLVKHSS